MANEGNDGQFDHSNPPHENGSPPSASQTRRTFIKSLAVLAGTGLATVLGGNKPAEASTNITTNDSANVNMKDSVQQEVTKSKINTDILQSDESITGENSLRSLAAKRGITVGSSVTQRPFTPSAGYSQKHLEILNDQFNLITPETQFSWRTLRPAKNDFNFQPAENAVNFGLSHDMSVRGQHLLWTKDIPDWVKNGGFSRNDLIDILKDHFSTVLQKYQGKVKEWTVVNEPGIDPRIRPDFWKEKIGSDYVDIAFSLAREIGGDQLTLLLNDNNNHKPGLQLEQSVALLKKLNAQGLNVHAGQEFHVGGTLGEIPEKSTMLESMHRLSETGAGIYITEMDVNLENGSDIVTEQELALQSDVYRNAISALLESGAGRSFTMWGFTDNDSWYNYPQNGLKGKAPLIFDKNYNPKPAFFALQDELKAS